MNLRPTNESTIILCRVLEEEATRIEGSLSGENSIAPPNDSKHLEDIKKTLAALNAKPQQGKS
jgi:hypothetical protein